LKVRGRSAGRQGKEGSDEAARRQTLRLTESRIRRKSQHAVFVPVAVRRRVSFQRRLVDAGGVLQYLSKKWLREFTQVLESVGNLITRDKGARVEGRGGNAFPAYDPETQFRAPLHLRDPY
jgi:hypothetical protein